MQATDQRGKKERHRFKEDAEDAKAIVGIRSAKVEKGFKG